MGCICSSDKEPGEMNTALFERKKVWVQEAFLTTPKKDGIGRRLHFLSGFGRLVDNIGGRLDLK